MQERCKKYKCKELSGSMPENCMAPVWVKIMGNSRPLTYRRDCLWMQSVIYLALPKDACFFPYCIVWHLWLFLLLFDLLGIFSCLKSLDTNRSEMDRSVSSLVCYQIQWLKKKKWILYSNQIRARIKSLQSRKAQNFTITGCPGRFLQKTIWHKDESLSQSLWRW